MHGQMSLSQTFDPSGRTDPFNMGQMNVPSGKHNYAKHLLVLNR